MARQPIDLDFFPFEETASASSLASGQPAALDPLNSDDELLPAIPDAVLEASPLELRLAAMRDDFPFLDASEAQQLPPVILDSHLVADAEDASALAIELDTLYRQGKLRKFRIPVGQDSSIAWCFPEDYLNVLAALHRREEHRLERLKASAAGSSPSADRRRKTKLQAATAGADEADKPVVGAVITPDDLETQARKVRVLGVVRRWFAAEAHQPVMISVAELEQAFQRYARDSAEAGSKRAPLVGLQDAPEEIVRTLLSLGVIVGSASAAAYYMSMLGCGRLLHSLNDGRRYCRQALKRRRNKQMLYATFLESFAASAASAAQVPVFITSHGNPELIAANQPAQDDSTAVARSAGSNNKEGEQDKQKSKTKQIRKSRPNSSSRSSSGSSNSSSEGEPDRKRQRRAADPLDSDGLDDFAEELDDAGLPPPPPPPPQPQPQQQRHQQQEKGEQPVAVAAILGKSVPASLVGSSADAQKRGEPEQQAGSQQAGSQAGGVVPAVPPPPQPPRANRRDAMGLPIPPSNLRPIAWHLRDCLGAGVVSARRVGGDLVLQLEK